MSERKVAEKRAGAGVRMREDEGGVESEVGVEVTVEIKQSKIGGKSVIEAGA